MYLVWQWNGFHGILFRDRNLQVQPYLITSLRWPGVPQAFSRGVPAFELNLGNLGSFLFGSTEEHVYLLVFLTPMTAILGEHCLYMLVAKYS